MLTKVYQLDSYVVFSVSGADAERFLQGQMSQDIKRLQNNPWIAGALLNAKGGIVSTLFLFQVSYNEYFIIFPLERIQAAEQRLFRYLIADEVNIEIQQNAKIFFTPNDLFLDEFVSYSFKSPFQLYKTFGHLYFVDSVKNNFLDYFKIFSINDLELERILSLFPVWGKEITEKTLLQELSNDEFWFSTTKGCYVGQEIVARVHSLGQVNKRLFLFESYSNEPSSFGEKIYATSGEEVGFLTSSARRSEKNCVALGYLKRNFWTEETFRLVSDVGLKRLSC